MREIKFRAWDNRNKTMWDFVVSSWNGVIEGYRVINDKRIFENDIRLGINEEFEDYDGEITIMQHTNLKDKNGKEIYEGDIVECEQLNQKQKGEVIFRKGMWSWEFKKDKDSWLYEVAKKWNGEIIGNIHSNPELLLT